MSCCVVEREKEAARLHLVRPFFENVSVGKERCCAPAFNPKKNAENSTQYCVRVEDSFTAKVQLIQNWQFFFENLFSKL